MKKITTFLMLLPLLVFAQFNTKDYTVRSGTPYRVVDAYGKYYFSEGSQVLMVKSTKRNIVIQKYDSDKGQEISKKEFPTFETGPLFDDVIKVGSQYYIFQTKWDRKAQTYTVFYKEINFEKGTVGRTNTLMKIKGKNYGIHFIKSHDNSKLLLKYRNYPKFRDDHKNYDKYGMFVFDSNLEELWGENIEMPYTEAEMNNVDYTIDSKGVLYMLKEVFDSETPKRFIDGQKNFHLELFIIEEGDLEIVKLDKVKFNINSIWLNEGTNNSIYLAGYYNEEDGYHGGIDGVFVIALDSKGDIDKVSNYKIPVELINMYEKERTQKRNKKKDTKGKLDFESLDLDKIYYQEDGSVLLIGEQYYVTSYTVTNSNGYTRTYYIYHYNDIFATKIDAEGDLEWMKKLPKSQSSRSNPGGNSFEHIYKNGNHYFIYIDHIDNLELETNKRPKNLTSADKDGVFAIYKIEDESGKVSKDFLFDLGKAPIKGERKPLRVYQFKVSRILETSEGISVEFYKKHKEDVMMHIDFK